jgi:hypothetical protein
MNKLLLILLFLGSEFFAMQPHRHAPGTLAQLMAQFNLTQINEPAVAQNSIEDQANERDDLEDDASTQPGAFEESLQELQELEEAMAEAYKDTDIAKAA